MAASKEVKAALKNLLRSDSVRLWEPPYSNEDGTGSVPDELIEKYTASTGFDRDDVADVLETLRESAVRRALKHSTTSTASGLEASQAEAGSPPSSSAATESTSARQSNASDTNASSLSPSMTRSTSSGRGSPAVAGSTSNSSANQADDRKSSKSRTFSIMFKRKKKEDVVSFQNEAFFLAQETPAEFRPSRPDEEPAYFDDLTPEQQKAFEERLAAEKAAKEKEELKAAGMLADDTNGEAGATGQGHQVKADESDDDDELLDSLNRALASNVPDEVVQNEGESKAVAGATVDESTTDQGAEKALDQNGTDADVHADADADTTKSERGSEGKGNVGRQKTLKRLGGKLRKTMMRSKSHDHGEKHQHTSKPPPVIVQSDFIANQMKMSDAQRIAVMTMVKKGLLSVDDAIEKVLAVEHLLHLQDQPPSADSSSGTSSTDTQGNGASSDVSLETTKAAAADSPADTTEAAQTAEHEPIRIDDSERLAIMNKVKGGLMSVDDAINLILDAEAEIAKAHRMLNKDTKTTFKLRNRESVFTDEDLEFMGANAQDRLQVLKRPKQSSKRPPTRSSRARASTMDPDKLFFPEEAAVRSEPLDPELQRMASPASVGSDRHSTPSQESTGSAEPPPTLAHDSVQDWLQHHGLEEHEEMLTVNGFDTLQACSEMTHDHIRSIGVEDDEKASKLLAAVNALNEPAEDAAKAKPRPRTRSDHKKKRFHAPHLTFRRKKRDDGEASDHHEKEHHKEPAVDVKHIKVTYQAPEYRAKDFKLTNEQQIEVMMMVKEGKMTMDEAIARVLDVEQKRKEKEQEKEVTVDEEGFSVPPPNAHRLSTGSDVFEKAFKNEDSSSDEDEQQDGDSEVTADGQTGEVKSPKIKVSIHEHAVTENAEDVDAPKLDSDLASAGLAKGAGRRRQRGQEASEWSAFGSGQAADPFAPPPSGEESAGMTAASSLQDLSKLGTPTDLSNDSFFSKAASMHDVSSMGRDADPFAVQGDPFKPQTDSSPLRNGETASSAPFDPFAPMEPTKPAAESQDGGESPESAAEVDAGVEGHAADEGTGSEPKEHREEDKQQKPEPVAVAAVDIKTEGNTAEQGSKAEPTVSIVADAPKPPDSASTEPEAQTGQAKAEGAPEQSVMTSDDGSSKAEEKQALEQVAASEAEVKSEEAAKDEHQVEPAEVACQKDGSVSGQQGQAQAAVLQPASAKPADQVESSSAPESSQKVDAAEPNNGGKQTETGSEQEGATKPSPKKKGKAPPPAPPKPRKSVSESDQPKQDTVDEKTAVENKVPSVEGAPVGKDTAGETTKDQQQPIPEGVASGSSAGDTEDNTAGDAPSSGKGASSDSESWKKPAPVDTAKPVASETTSSSSKAEEKPAAVWNPFGGDDSAAPAQAASPATETKKKPPAPQPKPKKAPPPVKSKPKKLSEEDMLPKEQASNAQHSRIYQALHRGPLYYESEEDKRKREEKRQAMGAIGTGSIVRQTTSLAATASAYVQTPDKEMEAMFVSTMKAEERIAMLKKQAEQAADEEDDSDSDEESVSAESLHFDEEFMAELDRRRKEREEQERQRAEELRCQFEEQQAKEQARLEKELAVYAKEKAQQQAVEEQVKEHELEETMERTKDLKFDFQWS